MTSGNHREHGRPRYQKGCGCDDCVKAGIDAPCRCPTCVSANRDYSKRHARLHTIYGGKDGRVAPATARKPERDPEKLVETQVRAELTLLPRSAQMPGMSATALAMARVLDDPTAGPQHPGAAGQLRAIMKEIRASSSAAAGGKSKLQLVREGGASGA